jgi:hypothetical protein
MYLKKIKKSKEINQGSSWTPKKKNNGLASEEQPKNQKKNDAAPASLVVRVNRRWGGTKCRNYIS